MIKNVGAADKTVRLVIALAAAIGAFFSGLGSTLGIVLLVVAAIMLVTAFVGFCPIYKLIGMNTCPVDKR